MANNFPKTSNAMEGNNLNRGPLQPDDPRVKGDGLDALTVWGLQEGCVLFGWKEAVGEGRSVKGDSLEWTTNKCKEILRANGIDAQMIRVKAAEVRAKESRAAETKPVTAPEVPKKNKGGRPKKIVQPEAPAAA